MKSELKTIKAEDFCYCVTDGTHDSPKAKSNGHYLITSKHLSPHAIDFSSAKMISEEDYQKIIKRSPVEQWDILFSMIGTIGITYLEKNPNIDYACKNMGIFKFNGDRRKAYWLYYFLQTPNAKEYIFGHLRGTTQQYLPLGSLRDFPIQIPTIEEQEKIIAILSAIDEKINLNTAINENLEQQIEAILLNLIQSDSMKDSIETIKLGDYLYIKGRIGWKGLKKDEYLDQSYYRIINGESLTKSGIDWKKAGYISTERYEESPEIMLQVGDILLSKDGTIGKIGFVDKLDSPSTVASGIFVIRNIKPEIISTQFIFYLLKSKLFNSFIASRTEGSVIPHLYQKDFMEFTFPLLNAEEMQRFDSLTAPLFSTIITNLRENELLSAARDSLLPKLMNGEIDVSKVQI